MINQKINLFLMKKLILFVIILSSVSFSHEGQIHETLVNEISHQLKISENLFLGFMFFFVEIFFILIIILIFLYFHFNKKRRKHK